VNGTAGGVIYHCDVEIRVNKVARGVQASSWHRNREERDSKRVIPACGVKIEVSRFARRVVETSSSAWR